MIYFPILESINTIVNKVKAHSKSHRTRMTTQQALVKIHAPAAQASEQRIKARIHPLQTNPAKEAALQWKQVATQWEFVYLLCHHPHPVQ